MSTFEHPGYVPLLERARADWDALSAEHDVELFEKTGMLLAGPPGAGCVDASIQTCRDHGIEHDILGSREIGRTWEEHFRVPEHYRGLWEPGAGCLACETAIRLMADDARAHGAEILEHTPVRSWNSTAGGVTVATDDATHHAGALILAAGPWMHDLLTRDLDIELTVTRQVQFWLAPSRHGSRPPSLPVWAFDEPTGFTFGFPRVLGDPGCKTCRHLDHDRASPDGVDRNVTPADFDPIAECLERLAPTLLTHIQRSSVCLYANSPDGAFIVDRHPEHDKVAFACGFTGHGFKFAPVIGRALVDLIADGRSDLPIEPFGLARLTRR
jgi:sarcosine oxidase